MRWTIVALCVSGFLLAGCGADTAPAAEPVTGGEPVIPTVEVGTPTPDVTPAAEVPGGPPSQAHPAGTLTGNTALDPIITAVTSRDRDATAALIQFSETTCTTADGLGGPPKCTEGQADGTPVTMFPVLGPGEGSFLGPDNMEATLNLVVPLNLEGLYAAYRVRDDAIDEDYWPAGEYGVVFTLLPADAGLGVPGTTLTLYVEGGRIVRAAVGLGTADEVVEREAGEMVLAPPGG